MYIIIIITLLLTDAYTTGCSCVGAACGLFPLPAIDRSAYTGL